MSRRVRRSKQFCVPKSRRWFRLSILQEAIDWLVRLGGQPPDRVRETVNWLIVGGLQVEPACTPLARSAAALRARHYHRTDRPISLADCFCLATAISLRANLATTDAHLAGLGGELGVGVIALPDSTGVPTRRRS